MSIIFDITTPDAAYYFLLDVLGFNPDELVMEYLVECGGNSELFWERNKSLLDDLNVFDVHLRSVYKELHADRETGC